MSGRWSGRAVLALRREGFRRAGRRRRGGSPALRRPAPGCGVVVVSAGRLAARSSESAEGGRRGSGPGPWALLGFRPVLVLAQLFFCACSSPASAGVRGGIAVRLPHGSLSAGLGSGGLHSAVLCVAWHQSEVLGTTAASTRTWLLREEASFQVWGSRDAGCLILRVEQGRGGRSVLGEKLCC